ncbi:MAG: D-alanyl-D-alanine carboxypeptidase [Rhodospirillaceae bacterium]|nr:D-alanyl-D-alanine carboxypeptidase [Rhodospirillaceae bacterium]
MTRLPRSPWHWTPGRMMRGALLALVLMAMGVSPAGAIETRAREAILIDMTTGTVLFEHNADVRMPTASMSKIMTMYMVFEALETGQLTLDDELTVSEYAWRTGGSKMFVEVNDTVRVEDLIRGVIVQSGNDASIVLAEGLGGTEEAFARLMTERAHELGMVNSHFANATGWPDPEHYSTARDLSILAQAIINDFPQYYHYYSETEFTYGIDIGTGQPITQQNRNPLLYREIGADGLKTGHTAEAGYGLTGSAVQDGRRLVLVVNGLGSTTERGEEAVRLLEWGFREFEALPMFDAGEVIETAEVWMGSPSTVPLVAGQDLAITVRRGQVDDMVVTARVVEPVPAPIAAGDRIATLVVSVPDMPIQEIPLVAGADIERQGFLGRVATGASHLVFGWLQ